MDSQPAVRAFPSGSMFRIAPPDRKYKALAPEDPDAPM